MDLFPDKDELNASESTATTTIEAAEPPTVSTAERTTPPTDTAASTSGLLDGLMFEGQQTTPTENSEDGGLPSITSLGRQAEATTHLESPGSSPRTTRLRPPMRCVCRYPSYSGAT